MDLLIWLTASLKIEVFLSEAKVCNEIWEKYSYYQNFSSKLAMEVSTPHTSKPPVAGAAKLMYDARS